ncbi:transcription cofactor vestigial-like protein 4 isoform X2 [Denticeps clupeoides]|uniref:transcription cofactor vestigial-like protein 4b isoform X2 n=1 Tax=Denticeps clupeoides TaxID=299321 RepID=UPI0010A2CF45|nr:transcription cofactor vestigial-like protein 4 isoform X2 [Denticeps clupeoides]XP_028855079.1 transcription cofactor vestigial-like protein 4 isoform X2 [Denticeps clupeoides]
METPLDVLSRAASLVHADDEKREAALRGEARMQPVSLSSSISNHRTGPPPISPNKRKYSGEHGDDDLDISSERMAKMSRLFASQLGKPVNGDYRKDPRDRSRSPIEPPHMSLHYAHMSSLAMDQPLALTKNSMDTSRAVSISPAVSPAERQQNRPSVITCVSTNNRNCNLSHCTVSHNGCSSGLPSSYRRASNTNTACDPVIEEHFRRSLGKNYKEPEPVTNSVSITGTVDDHFAKALGETWLQIKAKGSSSGSPDTSPSHMVNHSHSPSVVS